MSQLETSMACLMQVFDKYASGTGNKETLTNAELKTLMLNELPGFMKGAKNQDEVNKLMRLLDQNQDSEVDFKEFTVFIGSLICVCHDRCHKK